MKKEMQDKDEKVTAAFTAWSHTEQVEFDTLAESAAGSNRGDSTGFVKRDEINSQLSKLPPCVLDVLPELKNSIDAFPDGEEIACAIAKPLYNAVLGVARKAIGWYEHQAGRSSGAASGAK